MPWYTEGARSWYSSISVDIGVGLDSGFVGVVREIVLGVIAARLFRVLFGFCIFGKLIAVS